MSAADVFDVLVEEAGALEDDRRAFCHHWPECVEWRFMGVLGFGGKVWADRGRWYVTCYPEDRTPERSAVIERTNARLAALAAQSAEKEEG